MSTVEDFENAPLGATATHKATGARATKMDGGERSWVFPRGSCTSDEQMAYWGYTLDPLDPPTTAREALDLAWELAHPVKEGQVIPNGTRYLTASGFGIKEYTASHDFKTTPEHVTVTRTVEPLPDPEPEPDWLDAPAVLATEDCCPDQKVWLPETKGYYWECTHCDDVRHWSDLVDVTPLYPKGQDA